MTGDSECYPVEWAIPPTALTRVGNPVLSWLLSGRRRAAKVGQDQLLLHVTGRRTGRLHSTPVAFLREGGGRLLALTSSRWRVNVRGASTPVEVTLRGRRVTATAVLQEDPLAVAEVCERPIGEVGLTIAGRRLGIRVNLDRVPSREELTDAARREHLSVLPLELTGGEQ